MSLSTKLTFNVSVELVIIMKIGQTHQEFFHNHGYVSLANGAWLHKICTAAPGAELHDNPEIRTLQVRAEVFGDVRRVHS